MTWTPEQQAVREEWGLAELDAAYGAVEAAYRRDVARITAREVRRPRPKADPPPERDTTVWTEERTAQSIAFRYSTLRERAILALRDPAGEADAIRPLSMRRARQILTDPDDGLVTTYAPVRPLRVMPTGTTRDGRDLLTRLGADPSRTRGMLPCPAHEDRHASLSWRLADDGKPLLHCFAGCDFASIVAAA